jgi:hypothetical protein
MPEKKIKNFKNQLGANYFLVEIIWNDICEKEVAVYPETPLGENDVPIDQCTELEKILLACITHASNEDEKIILTKSLFLFICKNHNIAHESVITIKGPFLIIIEK